MTKTRQVPPTTNAPHFATLLLMALSPAEVGARIRAARIRKGWTHNQFATEAGVDVRTVQRWQQGVDKQGQSTLPRLGKLMELADLFGEPRSYFVETEDVESGFHVLSDQIANLTREIADLRRDLGLPEDDQDDHERD